MVTGCFKILWVNNLEKGKAHIHGILAMVTDAFSERICETLFSFYCCTFWKITHCFDVAQVVGVSGQFVEGSKKVFWLINFFLRAPLGCPCWLEEKGMGDELRSFVLW